MSAEWLKILLLASITIGLWLSLNLFFYRTGNKLANRLLMAFVMVQLLPPINVYTQMAFGGMDWCWLLTSNLTWLYGPFLLAFLLSFKEQHFSNKQIAWHTLPFFIVLIYRISVPEVVGNASFIAFSLFTQVFSYLIYCGYWLLNNMKDIQRLVNIKENSYYYWLLYLIIGLFILMLVDVILISQMMWFTPLKHEYWQLLVTFISLYLQGVALFSLFRPKVFYNDFSMECQRAMSQLTGENKKYKELNTQLAEQLALQLDELMCKDEPYLENELSLDDLAVMLKINKHQLSELLNVHLGRSFYDYINQYRIKYSMTLLKNGGTKKAILTIAFEAGFNNKNSFYRLFKLNTGLTPTEFRKSHLETNI
jgi:AraC-like DNA-binding protein